MIKISDLLGYQPIDIHSHLDHGAAGDHTSIVSPAAVHTHLMTRNHLRHCYDAVGIGRAAFSTYSSCLRPETIPDENRYLMELARKEEWVYQWAVVDPRQEETFRQADALLPLKKTLGIKIHPKMHGYTLADHGDAIFSFASERKAVILTHPEVFPDMLALADRYPRVTLIIAHLGNDTFINTIAAAKHGNIYTDTSGSASHQNNIIERAVEKLGPERILFGTDTYSAAFQLGRIAWADIPEKAKRKILLENAQRLFPDAFF